MPTAYFVGLTPELFKMPRNTLLFRIVIQDLNQLWMEWDS